MADFEDDINDPGKTYGEEEEDDSVFEQDFVGIDEDAIEEQGTAKDQGLEPVETGPMGHIPSRLQGPGSVSLRSTPSEVSPYRAAMSKAQGYGEFELQESVESDEIGSDYGVAVFQARNGVLTLEPGALRGESAVRVSYADDAEIDTGDRYWMPYFVEDSEDLKDVLEKDGVRFSRSTGTVGGAEMAVEDVRRHDRTHFPDSGEEFIDLDLDDLL